MHTQMETRFSKIIGDCHDLGSSFVKKYGFTHIRTLIRGTLRYEGYAFIMRSLCRVGLFLKEKISDYVKEGEDGQTTWTELMASLVDKHFASGGKHLA